MSSNNPATRSAPPAEKPRRFVFVLLDNFTLLCFAAAVESLRIANRMAGRKVYEWKIIGEGGDIVYCSAGSGFKLDGDLDELQRDDTVLVCGGIDVQTATTKRVLGWLRREARKGVQMGGLCTAAHTLAKAGLLDGKKATIHWENQDNFGEDFPDVSLTTSVFVIDGNRLTTAGGTSSIDLMLKLIADDEGEDLANMVADQLIYSSIRTDQDTQRLSVPTRIGVRHPKLSAVIQMMENNIEEPISPSTLARDTTAGAALPALSEPKPEALLYGIAAAKGAQPADADRHERHQRGTGLRLCLTVAFFQMLPRAL